MPETKRPFLRLSLERHAPAPCTGVEAGVVVEEENARLDDLPPSEAQTGWHSDCDPRAAVIEPGVGCVSVLRLNS